jgi:phage anti-repressor protein
MELIKVQTDATGQSVVSARELYAFLEATERFSNWCNRMFAHGFVENQDFTSVKFFTLVNNGAKREVEDYALTLDCAKQISMLQRNEKGTEARLYFLDCEKKLKAIEKNGQSHEIASLRQEISLLRQEVQQNKQLTADDFQKVSIYFSEMQNEIDGLKEHHQKSSGEIENTVSRVDKIEDYLDFKAIACVYVMYNCQTQLYKIGSSHNAKGRKKQFEVVEELLETYYEIPTISRDEAYTLENALKKRFKRRHARGEWYDLKAEDLEYLYELQQNNRKHLARIA